MISNAQKRLGYHEIAYNFNNNSLWAISPGDNYIKIDLGGSGDGIEPGGANLSTFTNDVNFVISGSDISLFNNDANYVSEGADISTFTNDAGYLTSTSFPVVDSLPTTNLAFGNVCALSTDNNPYFYNGTAWQRLYLADAPPAPDDPDTD